MKSAALSLIASLAIVLVSTTSASAEIAWENNLRTAHAQAQAEGKLLLLHFYSDNCVWCDKLDAGAFQDPSVAEAITKTFIPVKIHANSNPKLAEMFKVERFPSDVVVTIEGRTLAHGVSPQESRKYIAMLSSAIPAGSPAPTPAATMVAQASAAPANAAPAEATPANKTQAGPAAMSLPPEGSAMPVQTASSKTSTKNQLVSSRTDGMSLSMPTQAAAPEQATVAKAPAAKSDSVKTSVQPSLAMDGFCSISVVDEARWVEGSPDFGVIHLGKLYLFASEAKMKKFLADPIPYTPVLNEIDVVRFFEERTVVAGKREWAMQDQDTRRMFFFADEASMLHFEETHERYVRAAIEVMAKAVKESNPGL